MQQDIVKKLTVKNREYRQLGEKLQRPPTVGIGIMLILTTIVTCAASPFELAGVTVTPHVGTPNVRFRRAPIAPLDARVQLFVRSKAAEGSFHLGRVLFDGKEAIQGSSEIITHLEQRCSSRSLTPAGLNERRACVDIEQAIDARLGENIRRVLYYSLLAYPDFIRYCLTCPMPRLKQLVIIRKRFLTEDFTNSL